METTTLGEGIHPNLPQSALLFIWLCVHCRFGPYFCEPIIAGLDDEGVPFICTTDLIGAK